MENAKDEGEGEGEEKEQRLAVETAEAGGELLSTVHMQSEQWWRMQKTKEKGKGKRKKQWLAVEASGERELLSTDGQRSFFFSSVFALLLLSVYKNKTNEKRSKNNSK